MEDILDLEMRNSASDFNGGAEITRVWYGQGENAVLVWEKGMDLPAASEADEAAYGYSESSAAYWEVHYGPLGAAS